LGGNQFQPHTLLLEVLEEDLRLEPEKYVDLYSRLGLALEGKDLKISAIEAFRKAGLLEECYRLLNSISNKLLSRQFFHLFQKIAESLGEIDRLPEKLQICLCQTWIDLGKEPQAEEHLLRMNAKPHNNDHLLFLVAHIELRRGNFKKVIELMDKAISIAPILGNKAIFYTVKSDAEDNLGLPFDGFASSEKSLEIANETGNSVIIGVALTSLAPSYFQIERIEEGKACFKQALDLALKNKIDMVYSQNANFYGFYLMEIGDLDNAKHWIGEGLKFDSSEPTYLESLLLVNLGLFYLRKGEYQNCLPILKESDLISPQFGLVRSIKDSALIACEASALLGDFTAAKEALGRAKSHIPLQLMLRT
jgi:tetratricopeptide (TPR) repeat protein